jgi:hypothetical protein
MLGWYCHWGWPKAVAEIYLKAKEDLGGYESALHYGPAHVVWEDENFNCAQSCLDDFEKYRGELNDDEAAIVRRSLEELAALPESVRCAEPEDYDNEHPEDFPPPDGMEMVRL